MPALSRAHLLPSPMERSLLVTCQSKLGCIHRDWSSRSWSWPLLEEEGALTPEEAQVEEGVTWLWQVQGEASPGPWPVIILTAVMKLHGFRLPGNRLAEVRSVLIALTQMVRCKPRQADEGPASKPCA